MGFFDFANAPLRMKRKKIGGPSTTLGTTWKKFKKVKKQTARGGSTAARNDTEKLQKSRQTNCGRGGCRPVLLNQCKKIRII